MGETKEKILLTALRLFSIKGFDAVSTSDIASVIGITKGALYKHYKNKQDIFDSIVARMEKEGVFHMAEIELPEGEHVDMLTGYQKAGLKNIGQYSLEMFDYWTKEEIPNCFRKMLLIEQYRNDDIAMLYSKYLTSGPLSYLASHFKSMAIATDDADAMKLAVEFYSPMYMMYSLYDVAEDKQAIRKMMESHIEKFEKMLQL